MSETYSVVLTGQCLNDEVLESVKGRVAEAFKLSPQQADKLFCGKPIALKRDLDKGQAVKFSARLQQLGAHTLIKAQAVPVTEPAKVVEATVAKKPVSVAPKAVEPVLQKVQGAEIEESNAMAEQAVLTCPRCGHEQVVAKACSACKMDLTLHLKRLERRAKLLAHRVNS